jgi:hypothetical protein
MFLHVSNKEFTVELWDGCSQVLEGVANGLLVIMASLLVVVAARL